MAIKLPSKKQYLTVIVALGLVSLLYLIFFSPFGGRVMDGKRVYQANSLRLKFVDGDVVVKARDGHIAYIGSVKKGYADGDGELYDKKGNLLYCGSFENSQYQGEGKLFYKSGTVKYEGDFSQNQYAGAGKLYTELGILQYEGEFADGMKTGQGTSYDEAGQKIYTGSFSMDEPVYQWFLGRNGAQIAEVYFGEMNPKEVDGSWLVSMPELSMCYSGTFSEENEGGVKAETIFVNQESFVYGNQKFRTTTEVKKALGEPLTHGNFTPTELEKEACSAFEIEGDVVATVFYKDDVTYTFFSLKGQDDFFMIEMQGA